jgi:zinc transport system ATP-binding protein
LPRVPNHMSLISAQNISVAHAGKMVLSDVSLVVNPSEIVTILGPNGSGKSTLLRAILGILPLMSGHVRRQEGLRLGYVPQKLALDRAMPMTVRRFLSLPTRVSDPQADAALARVGMQHIVTNQMTTLSGGQFQRVMLARALLADPQILIMDEPTQGLDQQLSLIHISEPTRLM